MMNNRKIINDLNKKIELLEKDKESKENQIINILDANKELSLHNNHLENKIRELNIKLSKSEGKLDKIKNMYRTLTGEELD